MFVLLLTYSFVFGPVNGEHTSPQHITLQAGRLLKRIEVPKSLCYIQYGKPIDHLSIVNPAIEKNAVYPMCLCEEWYPLPSLDQCLLHIGVLEQDPNIVSNGCAPGNLLYPVTCELFAKDETCSDMFWIGSRQVADHRVPMKTFTYLQCSYNKQGNEPKFPVEVYKVDKYDVGERCNIDAIQEFFSQSIEVYRRNSQFYWQIMVYDSDLYKFCDSFIQKYGAVLRVHFRCADTLPKFEKPDLHTVPEYRKTVDFRAATPCYELGGLPNGDYYTLQNLESMMIPTPNQPVCVCECHGSQDNCNMLQPNSSACPVWSTTCGASDGNCIQRHQCSGFSDGKSCEQEFRIDKAMPGYKVALECRDAHYEQFSPKYAAEFHNLRMVFVPPVAEDLASILIFSKFVELGCSTLLIDPIRERVPQHREQHNAIIHNKLIFNVYDELKLLCSNIEYMEEFLKELDNVDGKERIANIIFEYQCVLTDEA